jgi:hypothetical protein
MHNFHFDLSRRIFNRRGGLLQKRPAEKTSGDGGEAYKHDTQYIHAESILETAIILLKTSLVESILGNKA